MALGATATEALSRVAERRGASASSGVDLLEAFTLDQLGVLQQPGGAAIFKRELHRFWFGSRAGGVQWEIVDRPTEPGEPPPPPSTAKDHDAERKWLQELADQARLDGKQAQLVSLQRQLYELWWKRRRAALLTGIGQAPVAVTDDGFAAALDDTKPKSLAGRIKALRTELQPKPGDPPAPARTLRGQAPTTTPRLRA